MMFFRLKDRFWHFEGLDDEDVVQGYTLYLGHMFPYLDVHYDDVQAGTMKSPFATILNLQIWPFLGHFWPFFQFDIVVT